MADTIAYTSVSILYMMLRFVGSSVNTCDDDTPVINVLFNHAADTETDSIRFLCIQQKGGVKRQ